MAKYPVNRRQGFTLVELLVVIGIIALLISILLPSLAKARQSAERVACLSNLQQISTSLQMYANEQRGVVPPGHITNKQHNYKFYQNGGPTPPGRMTHLGLIYTSLRLKAQDMYCCPANKAFASMAGQPWPPGPPTFPNDSTRIAYGVRPTPPGAAPGNKDWNWDPSLLPPSKLLKIQQLKNAAVVADVFDSPERISRGHGSGLCVLFANGGAVWVPQGVFMPILRTVNPAHSLVEDPKMDQIWALLDQQQ